jgi:glycosyltransferase involved in cell wall biosynthesis
MRILQLAPPWETVPPPAYGGIESVVGLLADGLVRRGHEVTLWASGDSLSLARLRSVYPRSLRTAHELKDRHVYEWVHVAEALREARQFDIIHNHAGELAMAMAGLVDVPTLSTMHGQITPDAHFVWQHYLGHYNTISVSQHSIFPSLPRAHYQGVIHNSIDVGSFQFSYRKDDYLLHLSRISEEKGTHLAIQVAKRLGVRLIVAGKVDAVDRDYFHAAVEPEIDGKLIQFYGEADSHAKRQLYAHARCLLLPICWEEPFGLVMPEAMACGTPVIAFARGAALEIVVHGETGYLVEGVDQMVAAVKAVDRIDPYRCRQHVERCFDTAVMVEAYLAAYQRVLAGESASPAPAGLPSVPATIADTGPEAEAAVA